MQFKEKKENVFSIEIDDLFFFLYKYKITSLFLQNLTN